MLCPHCGAELKPGATKKHEKDLPHKAGLFCILKI